jgi:hypothetical protein
MTYFPAMGSIEASSFNDTRFPGIAYATNPATHALFTDLQRQLNRVAYTRKLSTRVAEDGKIGGETLSLAKVVGPMMVDYSSIRNLATMADVVRDGAKSEADGAGAPAKVPSPIPTAPPKIITPSGSLINAPALPGASLIDSVKNLGMPVLLLLGVGAVGVGYYVTKKAK